MNISKVPLVQFLRFIFILIIVIYNFPIDSILYKNTLIKNINIFITFFFVLSAYLLYFNVHNKNTNLAFLWNYSRKIFLKIYPIHFLLLIFFGLIEIVKIYYINEFNYKPLYDTYELKDFILNFLFLNGFELSPHTFNQPSWSVSLLVWIIISYLILNFINKKLVIAFSFLLSVSLLVIIVDNYNYEFMYKYRNLLLTFSFSMTYLVCHFLNNKSNSLKIFSYFFFLIIISMLALLTYYASDLVAPFLYLLIIHFLFTQTSADIDNQNFSHNNLFVYLGNVSFIWYMSHFLFCFLIRQVLKIFYNYPINSLDNSILFGNGSTYIVFIVLLSSLIFSIVLFEIQKKINRYLVTTK